MFLICSYAVPEEQRSFVIQYVCAVSAQGKVLTRQSMNKFLNNIT